MKRQVIFKQALMKKSVHLAKIAGIDVSIHWTFFLLLGWIFLEGTLSSGLFVSGAYRMAFTVAAFTCVLLHEFGHAMAARYFGIPTHEITLLPVGGVAQLARIPRNPWQEFVIAIAGPAVNVVLSVFIFFALFDNYRPLSPWVETLLYRLLYINVGLVLFNLVPAFPMDGGRIFRAFLAWLMASYENATRIAVRFGQLVAIAFGTFGMMVNPMLALVAGFIVFAAELELRHVLSEQVAYSNRPLPRRNRPSHDLQPILENRLLLPLSKIRTFSPGR